MNHQQVTLQCQRILSVHTVTCWNCHQLVCQSALSMPRTLSMAQRGNDEMKYKELKVNEASHDKVWAFFVCELSLGNESP